MVVATRIPQWARVRIQAGCCKYNAPVRAEQFATTAGVALHRRSCSVRRMIEESNRPFAGSPVKMALCGATSSDVRREQASIGVVRSPGSMAGSSCTLLSLPASSFPRD